MNNFHLYNIETFKKYQLLKEHTANNWSYPLLVSPNSLNEKGKILYIGQETNTWGRNMKFSNPIIELENMYDLFMKQGATNRPFWKFIKEIIENNIDSSIVWANLLLCGKKDGYGTPCLSDEFKKLSSDYLLQLYYATAPSHVIIASSACGIYGEMVQEFLSKIHVSMYSSLNSSCSILVDDTNHIFWTYHPKYLSLTKNTHYVQQLCKEKIRK